MRTTVLATGFVIGAVAVLGAHVTIGPIPEGVRVTNVLAGGWSTELRREDNRIVGLTWTMEIPPVHFAEFVFNARNPREAIEISWKVTQRFADGTSREWTPTTSLVAGE